MDQALGAMSLHEHLFVDLVSQAIAPRSETVQTQQFADGLGRIFR